MELAQAPLLVERVDLDDDPVDLVAEVGAALLPRDAGVRDLGDGLETLRIGVRAEAARPQPVERLPLGAELIALEDSDAVDEDRQGALSRDRSGVSE